MPLISAMTARLARLARFEQFDDTRQTAGDVLGLGGCARDLREHVARVHLFAVAHHQVSVRRHKVTLFVVLGAACRADDDGRHALFVR